jgi:DNA polymerase III subunit epsilon
MKRLIILDTETTGLSPQQGHKLIEICGMEVINGVKTGEIFHTYINPERDVPQPAFAVHGIATEFLQDKSLFSAIAPRFVEFIKEATLVIHNAKFDVGFLNYELKQHGHPLISYDNVIDTLLIARKKFPGSPANLDALCKRFKVSLDKREKHGAIIDVELLYEVYRHLIEDHLLIKTNINNEKETKKDLLTMNASKAFRESRKFTNSKEELEEHLMFLKKIKAAAWNN